MVPEDILKPFIKHFQVPDSLVRLLYLLLQREIETNYASLDYSTKYDTDDPAVRYAKGLLRIFNKLPPISEFAEGKLHAPLRELAHIDDEDVRFLHRLCTPTELNKLYDARRLYLGMIDDAQRSVDQGDTDAKRWVREHKDDLKGLDRTIELLQAMPPYLTRFWSDLLSFNVSFELPYRNEHTHIIGAPGTGKSELIKQLVHMDLQTDASIIAMAPKGNLIETLARLPSDRIIWVKDWSHVGLNLSDLDRELIIYVFESLLEAAPTPKQKAFLMKHIPQVSSIKELRTLKLDKKYAETFEDNIEWRLDLIPPLIDEILSRETNISILDVMDGGEGKVLLLDTKHLGEGAAFIGRFFIGLIAKAVNKRKSKRPCYVYIDEAPVFVTDYIENLLDMAREANIGLTLAAQTLVQYSPRLRQSVHNAALKFVGTVNHDDAVDLGQQTGIDPQVLKNLPRLTFMLSGVTRPFPITVTPGAVDRLATIHRSHFVSYRTQEPAQYTDVGTKPFKWPRD